MSSSHVTALCSYPHSLHSSPDTLRFTPTFLYLVMIRFNAIGHAVYKVEVLSPVCLSVRNRIRYSIYPLTSESPQSDFLLVVALDPDNSSHRADTFRLRPRPRLRFVKSSSVLRTHPSPRRRLRLVSLYFCLVLSVGIPVATLRSLSASVLCLDLSRLSVRPIYVSNSKAPGVLRRAQHIS